MLQNLRERSRKHKMRSKLLVLFLLLSICLMGQPVNVFAAPIGEAKVIVESYRVTEDMVTPGEEFDLTLALKNTSDSNGAWDVLVSLEMDTDKIYPVYGTSNQVYIDRIEEKGTTEVTFRLKANTAVQSTYEMVKVNISSYDYYLNELSKGTFNTAQIQIPFAVQGAFVVTGYTLPDQAVIGTKTRISATYHNTYLDELTDLSLVLTGDGLEHEYQKSLGNIAAGQTNAAEAYLDFDSAGYKTMQIYFQYTDAEGEVHQTDPQTFSLIVYEGEADDDITVVDETWSAETVVKISLVGAALLIGIFVWLLRRNKSSRS